MKIISDDTRLNGVYLQNIHGTNLWQRDFCIPFNKRQVEFGVSFIFDSSVQVHVWKLGTFRVFEQNTEFKTSISRFSVESSLMIKLALDQNIEEEYYSHCVYILKSARDGEDLNCMTQIKALEKMSWQLNAKQREGIFKKIIQAVQKGMQIQKTNTAGFLCFMSQMNLLTSQMEKNLPIEYAKQIFLQCLSTICVQNPTQHLWETIESLYKTAFREEANFLSYCNYMYHIFGPKTSCEMLPKWKRCHKLLPKDCEHSRKTLKSLVENVFHPLHENSEISDKIDFLKRIQESITLEFQIEIIRDLELRKISPLDQQLEIFYVAYEKKINKLSRKGEIVPIIHEWNRMIPYSVFSADKLRERTQQYLIESLGKASDLQLQYACSSFQELFVDSTLFTEAASKIPMLKKMATSLNGMFHSLMPICLNEQIIQNIPIADVESIVLSWFSNALKHHCKKKSIPDKASDSLEKLYSYVDKIALHPLLRSKSDLKRKVDKQAFEYLKEFDIIDIVNFVPEMTKLENGVTEEIFKDHLRELFEKGLQNKDLEKRSLFKHIKKREVDSQ